jgi:hypothetical protein
MDSLPSGVCYRHWPVDNAKACVLLAHGLAIAKNAVESKGNRGYSQD